MANKDDKAPLNVEGKYYVDTSCIGCGQCHDIAPDFFVDDPENGGMYVPKQPEMPEDISLCEQTVAGCPIDCIGNDGDE